jgi:hypothetical protein
MNRLRAVDLPLAGLTAAAAALLAALAGRVGDWAVMTDELLYERLALSIADSGSPLPVLHGERVDAYAQLYPILLAPVFALFEHPEAVAVAHAWNGVLFASAAVPAYLLAREVGLPRWMRYASAVFAVVVPWAVIAGFLMTESAAYPAFLWAIVAIQRAVAAPSDRRGLLAVAAIGVAALARPQLGVLGVVLVAAALFHDLRFGRGRASLRCHRVPLAAAGLVALAAVVFRGSLLGTYAPTVEEGNLVSFDALRSAAVHLDVVAVALGIVPLLLGLGWALEAAVRGPDGPRHAFASVTAGTAVVLTLVVGSFVTRFGIGVEVKDRYLFYLAPLLFVASATALDDPRPRLIGLLATCAFFVLTVGWWAFAPVFGVNLDSPASAVYEALTRRALDLGIETSTLVALAAALVAVVLFVALRRAPRGPLAAVVLGATIALAFGQTAYTFDRLYASSGPSARPLAAVPNDELAWIDRSVADGDVAMLAYSVGQDWWPSAVAWWDVEFWNTRVKRAYLLDGRFTYTPESFPREQLRVDPTTGAIEGGDPPEYVARTTLDARFAPAGDRAGSYADYEVVRVERPFRAAWLAIGLEPDGWTRPGRPASIRVYPPGGRVYPPGGRTRLSLTLSAPDVEIPRGYQVGAGVSGALSSTESAEVSISVCVPQTGFTDVPIVVDGTTFVREIPTRPPYAADFRPVGLRVSRVSAEATGSPC